MKHASRAFSLVEVIVAMVCASLILAAATTATKLLYSRVIGMEQQVAALDDSKLLVDIMISEIVQAGGGLVRPWQALSQSCTTTGFAGMGTCAGQTDQIHIGQIAAGTQLTIASAGYSGAGNVTVQTVGGVCPVTAANGYPAAGRLVLLFPGTPVTGGGWQMKKCVPLGGGTCGCNLTSVTDAISVTPAAALTTANWSGGTVVPGQTLSYYLTATTRELRMHMDFDDDGVIDDRLMDTDIYDLQVQYGFDASPVDGALDSAWHETIGTANATALRMVRVGVIVGAVAPSRSQASTERLFGGTPITGPRNVYLVPASSAVVLRNLLLFF